MKNTIPKFPIVIVLWEDFMVYFHWKTPQEIEDIIDTPPGDHLHETVGYLIDKNEDRLILASSIATDGVMADLIRIPASQVRSFKVLRDLPKGGGV